LLDYFEYSKRKGLILGGKVVIRFAICVRSKIDWNVLFREQYL